MSENFHFLVVKFSIYLNRRVCLRNDIQRKQGNIEDFFYRVCVCVWGGGGGGEGVDGYGEVTVMFEYSLTVTIVRLYRSNIPYS